MKLYFRTYRLFIPAVLILLLLNQCSTPPSANGLIVDEKRNPITQAGITVTATCGANNVIKTKTKSDGTFAFPLTNISYPVVITATDGDHKISTVTLENDSRIHDQITLIELNY